MNIYDIIEESIRNRVCELEIAKNIKEGKIKTPTYLSVGTEHIPVILKHALKDAGIEDFAIFPQHRCHSYFLTFSENRAEAELGLINELLGNTQGCGKGMWGSASLSIPGLMFGHDGLLGSNAAIACGYAQATGKTTICVLGDAACEEDYVLSSMGYAATHKLPIVFLVENNGLSILTDIPTRRSWEICDVSMSFGVGCAQIDDSKEKSWEALYLILRSWIPQRAPCLVESIVCRHLWHAGVGNDGPPKWNSLKITANNNRIFDERI